MYAYVPNFVSIGLFCQPPIFAVFWTSAFSGVAIWQQSEKVEHGCTTTILSLSNGIKIVSVLQRLHCKIGRTISNVQKRDEQADRQTNRQKLLEMWANAQRDGRPAEHKVTPSVQRRKVWLTPTTRCRAVTLPRRETR